MIESKADVKKFLNRMKGNCGDVIQNLLQDTSYKIRVISEFSFAILFDNVKRTKSPYVGYIRVATRRPLENGQGIVRQFDQVVKYCQKNKRNLRAIGFDLGLIDETNNVLGKSSNGFNLNIDTFKDSYPALYYLMSHELNSGGTLVIRDTTCLWQNAQIGSVLMFLFKFYKVDIASADGTVFKWDDDSSMSILIQAIDLCTAVREKQNIVKRLQNGRKERIKNKKGINWRVPFGYRKEGDNICVEESEAKVIRKLFRYYNEDYPNPSEVAERLNEEGLFFKDSKGELKKWTRVMVFQKVRMKIYRGYVVYGDVEIFREDLVIVR